MKNRVAAKPPTWFVSEWLKEKGLKQADLVAKTGYLKGDVSLWVNERRRFNADVLEAFAKAIGVSPADLLRPPTAAASRESLLVGKVGAGSEVHRFDEGVVLKGVEPPPGIGPCNAAEVEGDSMYPMESGWLIFYGPEHQGIPEACVGKLSVVQIKDGPTLVKYLKRGSRKGLWRLESWNAPAREDVKVAWAARVLDIRPR